MFKELGGLRANGGMSVFELRMGRGDVLLCLSR